MWNPFPWKNGNVFDMDYLVRPEGKALATESVEDRWGDPKLAETLARHEQYWKHHPLYLNQREQDLQTLDEHLKEYERLPAIAGYQPPVRKRNVYTFRPFGGGGDRRKYGDGDDDDGEEEEEEDSDVRHMMGGGGSYCPCVMIVIKNPGRDENSSGQCLDRRGFAGTVALAAKEAIAESGREQDIHVAYVAPFFPNSEWKGDVPDRIADLFSLYLRLRLLIARPKVVLAVGSYVGKFLVARCLVRSMKFVERPETNHLFPIKLRPPSAKAVRGGGVELKVLHIVHPFLITESFSTTTERRQKYKEDYAVGFEVLKKQLRVGKRRLNAFSVLMNGGKEDEGNEIAVHTPPGLRVLLSTYRRVILAISGRPTRKEEMTHLVLKRGVGVVITLTERPLPSSWTAGLGCEVVHLPVDRASPPTFDQIQTMFQAVCRGWKRRRGALVHCKHGMDRSVMAVCPILMRSKSFSPSALVKRFREVTGDPRCLSKQYQLDFLTRAYERFGTFPPPPPPYASVKRERSEKPKTQLSTKKLRV